MVCGACKNVALCFLYTHFVINKTLERNSGVFRWLERKFKYSRFKRKLWINDVGCDGQEWLPARRPCIQCEDYSFSVLNFLNDVSFDDVNCFWNQVLNERVRVSYRKLRIKATKQFLEVRWIQ